VRIAPGPDQVESVHYRAVRPHLGDAHLIGLTQPARDVIRRDRDIQMKRHPGAAEMHPLGHRFQVIDRLACLDFNDTRQPLAGREDHVGKKGMRPKREGRQLLVADVHGDVKLSLVLGVKEANQTIVFELFPNGSDKDGHRPPPLGRLPKPGRTGARRQEKRERIVARHCESDSISLCGAGCRHRAKRFHLCFDPPC